MASNLNKANLPMRLFYLSDSTLPSTDANAVQVMRMGAALARSGVNLTIVSRKGEGPSEQIYSDFGLEPTFTLRRLNYRPGFGQARFYGWRAALAARLSNAHVAYCRCPFSALAAARLGVPVILELHALPPHGGRVERFRLPALFAHARFAGVCTITHSLRNDLLERYAVSPERAFVAPDGADKPRFGPPPLLPPTDRLRVGYTGHLYPGKGMEVILPLARACPWADFEVVGGRETDLSQWRASAIALKNLTFRGHLPPAQVASWLQTYDVVLLPNQRSVRGSGTDDIARWTSPLKLFEYMAAAKAILASDLPVLREVLRDGENAVLCNPENPTHWAEALEQLRDNVALRTRLGTVAHADWAANYSWDARARNVLAYVWRQFASKSCAGAGDLKETVRRLSACSQPRT